jgi:hypothetical protein
MSSSPFGFITSVDIIMSLTTASPITTCCLTVVNEIKSKAVIQKFINFFNFIPPSDLLIFLKIYWKS